VCEVTIYHNPNCGTSRNVLGLIRNAGVEPNIIFYLETPPTREQLKSLIHDMGLTVRNVLRQKDTPFDQLGLADNKWTDEELIDFAMQYPILVNRPIVVTPRGTKLCRPSETVLDILPLPQKGPFSKEDGQVVIDDQGNRVLGAT
jgi:arsenate reductase (glutaredoxin)